MKPLRLLLLDENPEDAERIFSQLAADGMAPAVRLAASREDFLRGMAESDPQVILSETCLSFLDAFSALALAQERSRKTPFIFVSRTLGEGFAAGAFKRGAVDCVPKDQLFRLGPAVRGALKQIEEEEARRKAERALRESEKKYRIVWEASPEAMILIDRQGLLRMCNRQTLSLLGYTRREEVIGKNLQDFMLPSDRTRLVERAYRCWQKESLADREFTFRRKDGAPVLAQVRACLVPGGFGQDRALVAFVRDITERKGMEERIKAFLQEKEILLKEVHHRVRNNLQVISSLLRLQARNIREGEAGKVLRDAQNRIRTLALVHENIHRFRDLSRIDLTAFVRHLTLDLYRSQPVIPARIALHLQMERVLLGVDAAVPCGLIINELVSNALEHAFPSGEGEIRISARKAPPHLLLRVRDDGIGLPEGLDWRQSGKLGLQLVAAMVEQLEGKMELQRNGGTDILITFPEELDGEPGARPGIPWRTP